VSGRALDFVPLVVVLYEDMGCYNVHERVNDNRNPNVPVSLIIIAKDQAEQKSEDSFADIMVTDVDCTEQRGRN
jgi:hypothetical protein